MHCCTESCYDNILRVQPGIIYYFPQLYQVLLCRRSNQKSDLLVVRMTTAVLNATRGCDVVYTWYIRFDALAVDGDILIVFLFNSRR